MRYLVLLSMLLVFTSCEGFIDNLIERNEQQQYKSPYRGEWRGSYSGDESGSLKIEVSRNGYVSVTRITQNRTESSFISGMIREDGALQQVSLESGFKLYGSLATGTGTWEMAHWKGTWSVTKQQ